MTATATPPSISTALVDEHSVLLWQACAYAEDLTDSARSGRRLTPTFDAMLSFLHYRLLPYLTAEERALPDDGLRDEHMAPLLLADHDRLRADVDNIEASRTRRLLALATETLVRRLDRHVRREETWVNDTAGRFVDGGAQTWAAPLVLTDDVDVDALPTEQRNALVLTRLQQMRGGETLRLRAGADLHPLWRLQHAVAPDTHAWVYEQHGPPAWVVRVTRRRPDTP